MTARTGWLAVLKEPLVHFLLAGAVIFAMALVNVPVEDDARAIVVGPEVERNLMQQFMRSRGRPPTPEEFREVVDGWVIDEVLYREGLAMGLDSGDPMIRGRVMQKMRLIIFSTVVVEPPTEAQLRSWFAANRENYDRPTTFSFTLARLNGDLIVGQARARNAALTIGEQGRDPAASSSSLTLDGGEGGPGEFQVTAFQDRPVDNVAALFGQSFADQLARQPLGAWRAVEGKQGWHVVRLERVREASRADFETLRPRLEADWLDAEKRRLAREALQELREAYPVRREAGT